MAYVAGNPPYLRNHLKTKRIKVSENRDGALVAYFVDAKTDAEWEQTPHHTAEEAQRRQRHEALLQTQ
jgi:hypothetical protein